MSSIQTLDKKDKKGFKTELEVMRSRAHPKHPGDEQVLTAALVKGLQLYVSCSTSTTTSCSSTTCSAPSKGAAAQRNTGQRSAGGSSNIDIPAPSSSSSSDSTSCSSSSSFLHGHLPIISDAVQESFEHLGAWPLS